MPKLNAVNVNQMAKRYVTDENIIVSFQSPEKATVLIPSKENVLAAIADSKNAKLEAKAEEDMNKPLIEKAPKAGKIKKATKNVAYGTTEWILNNGVKVIIKPTKFKQDEILLSAFSDGGNSKVKNNADVYSSLVAAGVVANNGLATYNSIELS
ncbi:insulinase family protein, partial [bacterium]|nr:insulinase family protein [bacterium]